MSIYFTKIKPTGVAYPFDTAPSECIKLNVYVQPASPRTGYVFVENRWFTIDMCHVESDNGFSLFIEDCETKLSHRDVVTLTLDLFSDGSAAFEGEYSYVLERTDANTVPTLMVPDAVYEVFTADQTAKKKGDEVTEDVVVDLETEVVAADPNMESFTMLYPTKLGKFPAVVVQVDNYDDGTEGALFCDGEDWWVVLGFVKEGVTRGFVTIEANSEITTDIFEAVRYISYSPNKETE